MYKKIIKPIFDFVLALIGIIILLPIMLIIYLVLLITLRENPVFKQKRVGLSNKIFSIYKFKTMTNLRDEHGNLLPDEQRLTRIGSFLRKSSLDELPQLFNVLVGNMSLIGPRPLLVEYIPLYNAHQIRRHEVKPGITGWVGVNGRNNNSWHNKFEMDVWYVDNLSFSLDIKIFFLTFVKIFKREGINSNDSIVSSQKFDGTN